MPSIREVMTTNPTTLPASASVIEAARAMKEQDIGDVIVLNDDQQIFGILTDRDIVVRAVADQQDLGSVTVGDICSTEVTSLSLEAEVGDAVKLMTEQAVRRLPIVEQGKPVGVVSLGDLAVTHDPNSGLADISSAPANN